MTSVRAARRTPGTGRRAWTALALAAAQHAAVDAACGVLLWGAVRNGRLGAASAWAAFLIYNLLAFAVQPLLGLAVDRGSWARASAVTGAALTAAGLMAAVWPGALTPAIVAAGLGNALFHVGGGILSLRLEPGRATAPGLFVAPGAAGVTAGILAGRAGTPAWPFVAATALLGAALWLIWPALGHATRSGRRTHATAARLNPAAHQALPLADSPRSGFAITIALLLLVVALRSFVGLDLVMPWKSDVMLLALLTAAVVLGKAGGGVAADRFGWRPVACGALVVSVPLLAVGAASPWAGIAGVLVFNMTMPVTLAATARLLPGQEGFAFGLTCLALFCGALPVLAGWASPLGATALAVACAAAAVALWAALAGRANARDRSAASRSIHPQGRSYA